MTHSLVCPNRTCLEASYLPSLTTAGKQEPWLAAIPPMGIKSHWENKKKCSNSPTKAEGLLGRKRPAAKSKSGDMAYLFFLGGGLKYVSTACLEGLGCAQDEGVPAALPPNLPSLLSLSFSPAIDRPGCDMVDQYSRDIKPAGCPPASASLSPLLFSLFSAGAAPRPPPACEPLTPTSEGPASTPHSPTAGGFREAESLESRERGEYGGAGKQLGGRGVSHAQVRWLG